MYKGGVKIKDIENILIMDFKQGVGRELTEKEKRFIQWVAKQQKLEQKNNLARLDPGLRQTRK